MIPSIFASYNPLLARTPFTPVKGDKHAPLFTGCCGKKPKAEEATSTVIPPPVKADTAEKKACCHSKKTAADNPASISKAPEAPQKKNVWENLKAQITEWFKQFFMILKTDLKALFVGNDSKK